MPPTISINLWWTIETEQGDLEHAVDVLENTLAPQLDCPVHVQVKDDIDLQSDAFDSYAAYLDAFKDTVDGEAGSINLCLYEYLFQGIDEAFEMGLDKLDAALGDTIPDDVYLVCGMDPDTGEPIKEQAPWIGYADSDLRPAEPTYTIVNASTRHLSTIFEDFFANVLMHEVLHSVVADGRAPAGDDHSYGTNKEGQNTPLLTAYAETLSPNDPPKAGCDQPDGVQLVNDHTTTLSRCTLQEVPRYMDETFDS